ncbi:hypothetical protein N7495_002933 [Penicillium taxi]|uniref:uncharacterized protein n=1 Tax=Penicillium taxi TaxID=168475 RepID=UPI0025454F23|nr:uncharacterized protein N7495_002933 [Penicillium taxi]KAJ5902405.1 hypothetical protein N7495_002933 [Penicillium taxi]
MSADEEDDYMSMVIEEPKLQETFTQKKLRERREAEARGRVPNKAERAAQEAARRDEALSKSTLDPSNKGFQMMAKLGFKVGQSLGKQATVPKDQTDAERMLHRSIHARAEPLGLMIKENRGGIGLDSQKKRKMREEAAEATKKIKQDQGDYRDRIREERELKRFEAQVRAAQKTAERLDTEAEEGQVQGLEEYQEPTQDGDEDKDLESSVPKKSKPVKLTSSINILYRGLVRDRENREREKQARHALQTSLPSTFFPSSTLPGYDDGDLDRDDKQALGYTANVEAELDEEDTELDAFNALEPAKKLHKLVLYLRDTYRYCFWCKHRYETESELENCPGLTEEDHD